MTNPSDNSSSGGDSGASTGSGAGTVVAQPNQRVLVMPEAFSAGQKEDWSSWLKYFKNCASLNKWTDEEKRDFLAVRLRGPAQETYQSLSETVQSGSFEGLADALGRKFAPAERVELYKEEFRTRKRQSGEKLGELAASISRMTVKACPDGSPEIRDQLAMDRFISALDESELRVRIRERNPKTRRSS